MRSGCTCRVPSPIRGAVDVTVLSKEVVCEGRPSTSLVLAHLRTAAPSAAYAWLARMGSSSACTKLRSAATHSTSLRNLHGVVTESSASGYVTLSNHESNSDEAKRQLLSLHRARLRSDTELPRWM